MLKTEDDIKEIVHFDLSNEQLTKIANIDFAEVGRGEDYSGKIFNHVTILGRATPPGAGIAKWWYICDCENHTIKSAAIADIKRGRIISCGCYNKKASSERGKLNCKDFTNFEAGDFIAIAPSKEHSGGNIKWFFKCKNCGYTKTTAPMDIKKGNGDKCVNCNDSYHRSTGETAITNVLTSLNISFISQKSFETCIFPNTGRKALFDFYLDDLNILIEYDGEQHFFAKGTGWNTEENLKETQYRDNYKTQWCKDNNIPLIRIPYTEINKINTSYILEKLKEVT